MASVQSTIEFLTSHGNVNHASATAEGVIATSWARGNDERDGDAWFEECAVFPIVNGNVSNRAVREWLGY